jgi:hypothetical protein
MFKLWDCNLVDKDTKFYSWLMTLDHRTFVIQSNRLYLKDANDAVYYRLRFGI